MSNNECLDKLVNNHWAYVEEMLQAHTVSDEIIEIVEFHYRSAMLHGIRHGVEMANNEVILWEDLRKT